jgi:hypothetical protein
MTLKKKKKKTQKKNSHWSRRSGSWDSFRVYKLVHTSWYSQTPWGCPIAIPPTLTRDPSLLILRSAQKEEEEAEEEHGPVKWTPTVWHQF